MLRHARVAPPGKKCAFVLTRDGRPVKVQRTIFSECFYTMAMNELWRVTGEARYQVRGRKAALRVFALACAGHNHWLHSHCVCKSFPRALSTGWICCQCQSFLWAPMAPGLLAIPHLLHCIVTV